MRRGAGHLMSAVAAAIIALPSSAWACRMLTPHNDTIAKYDGVVIVSITSGTWVREPGWNIWKLSARRLKVVAGTTSENEYEFLTTQSSVGCGETPLPSTGEVWVVYTSRAAPSEVAEAFPLSVVQQHDPRLANVR